MPEWLKYVLGLLAIAGLSALVVYSTKRLIRALIRLGKRLSIGARVVVRGFASGGLSLLYPGESSRYTRLVQALNSPDAGSRSWPRKVVSALATGGVSVFYESSERPAHPDPNLEFTSPTTATELE
jgi:hypothetical protein